MKAASFIAALFLVFSLSACSAFAPPHTGNDRAAYSGGVVQSVEKTAIAEYPYMSKSQSTDVHNLIAKAKTTRDAVIEANKRGNSDVAQNKLMMLANILAEIQAITAGVPDHG